jgi:5-methylcytosine-specific restriction protein A
MRNPDWTRDELLLALNLYLRCGRKQLDASHPDVIQLSNLLNQLPIHEPALRKTDFRNPQGVSMKLGNFLSLDPEYKGTGLHRIGKLDRMVWEEFSNDANILNQIATSIDKWGKSLIASETDYAIDIEDDEFVEGRILTRIHKSKERSTNAVKKKKRKVLRETGKLICEVCAFDFAHIYGEIGYGFAECHHLMPVSQLDENHKTQLAELAIVCANCHRIIHKSRPMLSIAELRAVISKGRS